LKIGDMITRDNDDRKYEVVAMSGTILQCIRRPRPGIEELGNLTYLIRIEDARRINEGT